jgi:hypothetical protein
MLVFSFDFVEVALQPIEAMAPQRAIGRQPVVDLAQLLRPQPIDPPLRVDARVNEPGLTQHAQVFRDRRLTELAELLDELGDGALAAAEQIEDAPSIGFGEDVEGGHLLEYA